MASSLSFGKNQKEYLNQFYLHVKAILKKIVLTTCDNLAKRFFSKWRP